MNSLTAHVTDHPNPHYHYKIKVTTLLRKSFQGSQERKDLTLHRINKVTKHIRIYKQNLELLVSNQFPLSGITQGGGYNLQAGLLSAPAGDLEKASSPVWVSGSPYTARSVWLGIFEEHMQLWLILSDSEQSLSSKWVIFEKAQMKKQTDRQFTVSPPSNGVGEAALAASEPNQCPASSYRCGLRFQHFSHLKFPETQIETVENIDKESRQWGINGDGRRLDLGW